MISSDKVKGDAEFADSLSENPIPEEMLGRDAAGNLPLGRRVIFAADEDSLEIAAAHLPALGGRILRVDDENFVEQLKVLISVH